MKPEKVETSQLKRQQSVQNRTKLQTMQASYIIKNICIVYLDFDGKSPPHLYLAASTFSLKISNLNIANLTGINKSFKKDKYSYL